MISQREARDQQPPYQFYMTLGCHLCEEAARLLQPLVPVDGITVEEIDIARSDALVAEYGNRIPVLRRSDDGRELDWPFTVDDVLRLTRPSDVSSP